MITQLPNITRMQIVARRLAGVVQPNDAIVVALPAQITYDIVSIDPGVIMSKENVTPADRVVAANGVQVNIRAANFLAPAEFMMTQGGEERLYVREGIVFGDCAG